MKKNNIKIKENIDLFDAIGVIENVVDSVFDGDNYMPWFKNIAEISSIITYFIQGIELEQHETIYECYLEDSELKELTDKIIYSKENKYASIMHWIKENIQESIEFRKQKIIHATPELNPIVEAAGVIIESFSQFSKLNISALSEENLQLSKKVFEKISESGQDFSPELFANVINTAIDLGEPARKTIIEQRENIKEKERTIRKLERRIQNQQETNVTPKSED